MIMSVTKVFFIAGKTYSDTSNYSLLLLFPFSTPFIPSFLSAENASFRFLAIQDSLEQTFELSHKIYFWPSRHPFYLNGEGI